MGTARRRKRSGLAWPGGREGGEVGRRPGRWRRSRFRGTGGVQPAGADVASVPAEATGAPRAHAGAGALAAVEEEADVRHSLGRSFERPPNPGPWPAPRARGTCRGPGSRPGRGRRGWPSGGPGEDAGPRGRVAPVATVGPRSPAGSCASPRLSPTAPYPVESKLSSLGGQGPQRGQTPQRNPQGKEKARSAQPKGFYTPSPDSVA